MKIESNMHVLQTSRMRKVISFESAKFTMAVLIPFILLLIVRVTGFKAENSVDAYYHIAVSDFGPSYYMSKKIPQLTLSVWSDNFSDKELGYHLILSSLRRLELRMGISTSPPFNSEALFFAFLVILTFVISHRAMGMCDTLSYSIALVILSPYFTNRLLMLRPHNLSIVMMIAACAIFHLANHKKLISKLIAFIIGFIGAWCYSNPHFLLLPAMAFAFAEWIKTNEKATILLPIAVFAGIILGYTLHPQFPNTFTNWKIQCVDVVWQAIAGTKTVALGTEFNKPGPFWFLKNVMPFIAFVCDVWLFVKLFKMRIRDNQLENLRKIHPTTIAMFAMATVAIIVTPLGPRAMEYAYPFILLSIGANIAEYSRSKQDIPYPFNGPRFVLNLKILLLVTAVAFIVFQREGYSRRKGMKPISNFATFMKTSGIPPNTVIANLIWSDYPFLLYSCPEYKYISGLDPMFSYSFAPERIKKLELFRRGEIKLSQKELRTLTGANYIFLRKIYKKYAKNIKKMKLPLLYDGPDGWLFTIPDQHK